MTTKLDFLFLRFLRINVSSDRDQNEAKIPSCKSFETYFGLNFGHMDLCEEKPRGMSLDSESAAFSAA